MSYDVARENLGELIGEDEVERLEPTEAENEETRDERLVERDPDDDTWLLYECSITAD